MPHYPLLAAYTALARPRCEWWRSLIGLVLIFVLYSIGSGVIVGGVLSGGGELTRLLRLREIMSGSSPFGLAVLFLTFLPMLLAVIFVCRSLCGRSLRTLLGAGVGADFRRAIWPLLALTALLAWLASNAPEIGQSTALSAALPWWPLIIALVFVQIAAEELLFRGYLLQQLGAWSGNNLWIAMVLPSALFGALHYDPATYGPMAYWPMLWAALFGMLACDLTARSGNLGAALAFHFVNNLSAVLLISAYGHLDGISLFSLVANLQDFNTIAPIMMIDGASILVSWLLIRLCLRV